MSGSVGGRRIFQQQGDALAAAEEQQRYLDSIRATVAALDWSRATLYKK
ncbi:UNVERIFIED_CONTAM: hypothetical protein QE602_10890 [Streptococcus suis]